MRPSHLFALLILGGCTSFQSNVGYDELLGSYNAVFLADGSTLWMHVLNAPGLNIVSLSSRVQDGTLYVGGARASSGSRHWQWLSLDVATFGLPPDWPQHVFWLGPDGRASPLRVEVSAQGDKEPAPGDTATGSPTSPKR